MAKKIVEKTKSNEILKNIKSEGLAIINIKTTLNNVIITISDSLGNALSSFSPAKFKFKGSKKSSPYASQKTADETIKFLIDKEIYKIELKVKGIGVGRDLVIKRFFNVKEIIVTKLADCTGYPYNGCRPPARRSI